MKQAFILGGALFLTGLIIHVLAFLSVDYLSFALVRSLFLLDIMLPVSLLALYFYLQRQKRNEPPLPLGIPKGNNLWMLLVIVPALYVIVSILFYLYDISGFDWTGYKYARQQPLIYCIVFVLLIPALQEFVFRGIMLEALLKRYPVHKALGAVTLIAALPHLYPTSILIYLPVSFFLAWLYYRSRSLIFTFISNAMLSVITLGLSISEKNNVSILGELTQSAGVLPVLATAVILLGVMIIFFNRDIIDSNKKIN